MLWSVLFFSPKLHPSSWTVLRHVFRQSRIWGFSFACFANTFSRTTV